MAEKDYSAADKACMDRWSRRLQKNEESAEHAEEKFKRTFSNLLKNPNTKRNLAKDGSAAIKDPSRNKQVDQESMSGFGRADDLPNGFDDLLPWQSAEDNYEPDWEDQ
jgi:hypothetical protein